jgi:hypothetical protein
MRILAVLFLALTLAMTSQPAFAGQTQWSSQAYAPADIGLLSGVAEGVTTRACVNRQAVPVQGILLCMVDKRPSANAEAEAIRPRLIERWSRPSPVLGDGRNPAPDLAPPRRYS